MYGVHGICCFFNHHLKWTPKSAWSPNPGVPWLLCRNPKGTRAQCQLQRRSETTDFAIPSPGEVGLDVCAVPGVPLELFESPFRDHIEPHRKNRFWDLRGSGGSFSALAERTVDAMGSIHIQRASPNPATTVGQPALLWKELSFVVRAP